MLNPNGAPTPVAWTRMRAPEASMDPMNPEWLAQGVAASAMMARYGADIDRDSAHEMLARKLEAGIAAARREAELEAEAKEAALREKEEAAQARQRDSAGSRAPQRRSTSTRPAPRSGVEKVLSSPTFWNKVITIGDRVVRDMMGTARKR